MSFIRRAAQETSRQSFVTGCGMAKRGWLNSTSLLRYDGINFSSPGWRSECMDWSNKKSPLLFFCNELYSPSHPGDSNSRPTHYPDPETGRDVALPTEQPIPTLPLFGARSNEALSSYSSTSSICALTPSHRGGLATPGKRSFSRGRGCESKE